jgi:hypothetical protein
VSVFGFWVNPSISNIVTTDADGNAYLEYVVANRDVTIVYATAPNGQCGEYGFSQTIKDRLVLMTVFADGSISTKELASRIYNQVGAGGPTSSWSGSLLLPGAATPDGQGGALATWLESFVDLPSYYMVSRISASGQNDFHLNALDGMNTPGTVVLDSNGTGYVMSSTPVLSTIVAFDINSGAPKWTVQTPNTGYMYMFAQDGGGLLFQSLDSGGNPIVRSVDATGNLGPSFSTGAVLTDSWGGQWYSAGPSLSATALPFAVDAASFWPESLGNPSQNGLGVPGCPCLVQSSDATLPSQPQDSVATTPESEIANQTASETAQAPESVSSAQLLGPSNCPICNLPQPPPSSCVTMQGTGAVYLILVGDSGLERHDLGLLFDLAAQQKANDLNAAGNKVVACRVSSVTDFHGQLIGNGLITGGVIFFGHSGPFSIKIGGQIVGVVSILEVGQTAAAGSNVEGDNVQQLCDPNAGCIINSYLGASATITLIGCKGAADVNSDYFANKTTSIAKMIAKQLARPVYAWNVGLYASQQDIDHDQLFAPTKTTKNPPASLPMYFVPVGRPGHKPKPLQCAPGGACALTP